MSKHRRRRLATRLLSALVIGVATIFVPKIDPKTHWSIPPTMEFRALPGQSVPDGQGR